MEEIWKPVVGYEGRYEVSSLGRINSINYKMRNYSCVLTPQYRAYATIQIGTGKDRKRVRIHRLVAQAFIENMENKTVVNHKNGNRYDNRVENLEWCTHSENHLHKYRVLGYKSPMIGRKGILNKKSKPIIQYSLSGEFIKEWCSQSSAGDGLGIRKSDISACCTGVQKTAHGFIWRYPNIHEVKLD